MKTKFQFNPVQRGLASSLLKLFKINLLPAEMIHRHLEPFDLVPSLPDEDPLAQQFFFFFFPFHLPLLILQHKNVKLLQKRSSQIQPNKEFQDDRLECHVSFVNI